tara:strand:+ start:373 stop:2226 length:1854 start_codon:yes stop_codon:yes gene_type:complete
MPRSYTANGGIILPANGEESGTWGTLVNENMDILDRLTNGIGTLTLSGTTHTLTTADGALSDGQFRVIVLGGSPSGTNTITVAPNDGEHIYFVKNLSGQSAIFTQGSGGDVTIPNGDTKFIYCDGNGSGAAVQDITSDLNVAGTVVAEGLTVNTSTDNAVIGQFILWDATGGAQPYVRLAHSLGASVGSHTAVTLDDGLGVLTFAGSTGSAFYDGAAITARSTQSFTGSNGGTKLEFKTTENSTQTLATKMTIDNDGNVGIGTTSPDTTLTVIGGGVAEFRVGNIGASSNSAIRISRNDTTVSSANPLGYLEFGGNDSTDTVDMAFAYVGGVADGSHTAGNNATALTFGVTASGSEVPVERVRLDSDGNLLVSTTIVPGSLISTSTETGVGISTNGYIAAARASATAYFNRLTADGNIVNFGKDGTTVGSIGTKVSSTYIGTGDTGLLFWNAENAVTPYDTGNTVTNGTIDLGVPNYKFKDLYLSGGVYLGGTVAANLLDDYERGTWTPVVSASTAGTSTTVATGEYTRVGGIVCLTGALDWSATTSWAVNDYVTVGGFPFTALYGGNAVGYSNRSYPTTSSQFIGLTTSSDCRLICVNADSSRHSDAIRFSLTIMV